MFLISQLKRRVQPFIKIPQRDTEFLDARRIRGYFILVKIYDQTVVLQVIVLLFSDPLKSHFQREKLIGTLTYRRLNSIIDQ